MKFKIFKTFDHHYRIKKLARKSCHRRPAAMVRAKQVERSEKRPVYGDTTQVDKAHLSTMTDLVAAVLDAYGCIDAVAAANAATPGDVHLFHSLRRLVFNLCDARQSYRPADMLQAATGIYQVATVVNYSQQAASANCTSSHQTTRDAVYAAYAIIVTASGTLTTHPLLLQQPKDLPDGALQSVAALYSARASIASRRIEKREVVEHLEWLWHSASMTRKQRRQELRRYGQTAHGGQLNELKRIREAAMWDLSD